MNGFNFTERVRRSLQIAREEAMTLRHEYVGTEHMLLGATPTTTGSRSPTTTRRSPRPDSRRCARRAEDARRGRRPSAQMPSDLAMMVFITSDVPP